MKYNVKKLTKKDYAWAQWGEKEMEDAAEMAYQKTKKVYESIKILDKEGRTFESVIVAMELNSAKIGDVMYPLYLLSNISPKENIRKKANELQKRYQEKYLELEYDEEIFSAVKDVKNKKEELTIPESRLFLDTFKKYKRMGFTLPLHERKKVEKISNRINSLSSDFQTNINSYSDYILCNKRDLTGMPDSYISSLKKDAKTNKYIVSLDYPEYFPFMRSADSEKKRIQLSKKFDKKGGKKNEKLILKIIELREERAKLLGYKNHGDFANEVRMSKNAETALNFLQQMSDDISKGAKQEINDLRKRKKKDSKQEFGSYDIAYYTNKILKEQFNIDNEEIKKYFPLDHVKKQMISLYSELFGLEFIQIKDKLWHKDAELYQINVDGELNGYVAMDLHPRAGKFGHAAVFYGQLGRKENYVKDDNSYIPDMCTLVCNFPKSTSKNPSLLSLNEVITLFHECGHALHHACTKTQFSSQAATLVKRDFVEAPSQILENWVMEEKILKKISSHYKTGEPLSKEMIQRIQESDAFMQKYFFARQMCFGLYDLILHTKGLSKNKTSQDLYCSLVKKMTGMDSYLDGSVAAGFGHLVGYDAGYYGYMWAKVYADDMYTRFQKEGILSKRVGKSFRKEILEVGSSRDEIDSVKAFLGRKPNNKAFLSKLGIK